MTQTLILMRHAKSSWDDPRLDDHARPLNKRGQTSAKAMGDWLRAQGTIPDQVFCSSAQRTQETFERLGLDIPAQISDGLYHASAERLLSELRKAQGKTVLMIGHNPGLGEMAHRLVDQPVNHPRFSDFPTCATLIAELPDQSWADVEWGTAAPRIFAIPREVIDRS